jgi:hypothetical protein
MSEALEHPTLAGVERGPRFAAAWAFLGLMFLGLSALFRLRESDGPWPFIALGAVATLFGVAQGLPRGPRRYLEWGAGALVVSAGAWYGWQTAQLPLGYIADYGFAGAWVVSTMLALAGALMCVLRATRRVGVLFCIAGLAGLLAFYAVVGLAQATGHTRWHEWKDSQKLPPSPSP